jgi:hypothetical protein
MSDVIDFLGRLGRDSELRYAPRALRDRAMSEAQLSPEVRAALEGNDHRSLGSLLAEKVNVCCTVFIPITHDEEQDVPAQKVLNQVA